MSLALSVVAAAQAPTTAPATPAPIRTLIGDVAILLRRQDDATLAIGAAGAARSVALSVRASDARRWADSATRLLATARPPARGRAGRPRPSPQGRTPPPVQRARAVLEEPGVGSGSFVLTRLDSAGTRSWLLFIDDAELNPLRQPLGREEAATLVRLLRRAAAAPRARATRPATKRPPAKRPPAKRPPASPPR